VLFSLEQSDRSGFDQQVASRQLGIESSADCAATGVCVPYELTRVLKLCIESFAGGQNQPLRSEDIDKWEIEYEPVVIRNVVNPK
jgi:hypothetical protein